MSFQLPPRTPPKTGAERRKLLKEIDAFCDEIQQTFFERNVEDLKKLSFFDYYNRFYKYVRKEGEGPRCYDSVRRIIQEYVNHKLVPAVREGAESDDFPGILLNAWEDYDARIRRICNLTICFDRVNPEHYNDFMSIADFSVKCCKKPIMAVLEKRMQKSFTAFQNQAEGTDRFFAEEQFIELINSSLWEKLQVDSVYQPKLAALMDSFGKFYREQRVKLMEIEDEQDRLIIADRCLEEESERLKKYFDPGTRQLLMEIAENEIIFMRLDTKITKTSVNRMLEDANKNELIAIYNLLCRSDKNKVFLNKMFRFIFDYFYKMNQQLIDGLKAKDGSDAKTFIVNVFEFLDKYDRFFKEQFGEKNFTELSGYADKVFIEVINNQANAAELLASFMDRKLRVSPKDDKEGEDEEEGRRILMQTAFLLKYLEDKEGFMQYYTNYAGRRLLNNRSKSEALEMMVFQELQEQFGKYLTARLEGMLKDLKPEVLSIQQAEFEAYNEKNSLQLPVPLNVRVLTIRNWISKQPAAFKLPQNMEQSFEHFRKFYAEKHTNRKLDLWHVAGTVEVSGIFWRDGKKVEYFMSMSAYQAAVLMLFNGRDCLTLEQIRQELEVEREELISFITPMVKNEKILVVGDAGSELSSESEFKLNYSFASKHRKLRIPPTTKPENKLFASIDEDVKNARRHQIDAAIVRVMKGHKSLTIVELIAEVIKQVANRFKLNPTLIRNRADALVERNFLETKDNRIYGYVC